MAWPLTDSLIWCPSRPHPLFILQSVWLFCCFLNIPNSLPPPGLCTFCSTCLNTVPTHLIPVVSTLVSPPQKDLPWLPIKWSLHTSRHAYTTSWVFFIVFVIVWNYLPFCLECGLGVHWFWNEMPAPNPSINTSYGNLGKEIASLCLNFSFVKWWYWEHLASVLWFQLSDLTYVNSLE